MLHLKLMSTLKKNLIMVHVHYNPLMGTTVLHLRLMGILKKNIFMVRVHHNP